MRTGQRSWGWWSRWRGGGAGEVAPRLFLPKGWRFPFDQPGEPDPLLLWPTLLLTVWGLVMVYSSSIAIADAGSEGNPWFYLVRQLLFAGVGLAAGWWVYRLPMGWWHDRAVWLFGTATLLLLLVLVPKVGKEVNNAQRWIALGPLNVQPSEIMKFAMALFAAHYTVHRFPFMGSFVRGFLPLATVVVGIGALLLLQPDFGALVVISVIAFGVLFLGGLNLRIFAALVVVATTALGVLVAISPYRMARFMAFLDPWADPLGKGYQLTHALIAFGRGEWFGVGLGASIEKLFYLPEAHTDFILAVIAEELGWVGVTGCAALFSVLIWRIFIVGRQLVRIERYFEGLAVSGIGIWLGVQTLINMGVNVGLLPTKGLTLPFMSYGGSALVMNLVAIAFVLRAEWEGRQACRTG
ncbi:MAG: putative lipid II flippase FtsW [Hydrogenophilus sp.]|nr:putative lipid II flippase FtsW [Hydrogenophilus sp.]